MRMMTQPDWETLSPDEKKKECLIVLGNRSPIDFQTYNDKGANNHDYSRYNRFLQKAFFGVLG